MVTKRGARITSKSSDDVRCTAFPAFPIAPQLCDAGNFEALYVLPAQRCRLIMFDVNAIGSTLATGVATRANERSQKWYVRVSHDELPSQRLCWTCS